MKKTPIKVQYEVIRLLVLSDQQSKRKYIQFKAFKRQRKVSNLLVLEAGTKEMINYLNIIIIVSLFVLKQTL